MPVDRFAADIWKGIDGRSMGMGQPGAGIGAGIGSAAPPPPSPQAVLGEAVLGGIRRLVPLRVGWGAVNADTADGTLEHAIRQGWYKP